jgi:hypothetical protein
MARQSYNNAIDPVEVSLAIERFIVSEYPGSWTPARIDFDVLPSGFHDLGAVDEATPSLTVTREKFMLDTGLPRIRQFEAVTGLEGQLAFTLHSNHWRKVQVALGNYVATSNAQGVGSISSVHSNGLTFVLASTPTTPLAVGQTVILSSLSFDAIDALEVRIGSINTDNLTFTIKDTPIKSVTTGLTVGVYSKVTQYIGGRRIRYFHVLGVADFIDGAQVVHELKKASPAEGWEEAFTPEANGKVPITFNALGQNTYIGSCQEQVIMLRHYFPPLSETC